MVCRFRSESKAFRSTAQIDEKIVLGAAPCCGTLQGTLGQIADNLLDVRLGTWLQNDVVGHSAGAAILARMALDGFIAPDVLISVNGALLPLRGMPACLFSPMAKILARSQFVPRFVARNNTGTASLPRPRETDR